MARIYDNIDVHFTEGLHDIIGNNGVKRVDFCVGYFNLRGWNQIMEQVDNLPGDMVEEKDSRDQYVNKKRYCRLLIGMHRPDEELIRALYSGKPTRADSDYIQRSLRRSKQDV